LYRWGCNGYRQAQKLAKIKNIRDGELGISAAVFSRGFPDENGVAALSAPHGHFCIPFNATTEVASLGFHGCQSALGDMVL
jgi:hypothetical protein